MPQIRVNLRTAVNSASIRKETRNGREVMIVPSATLPDDVVMNKGLYPADEIAKSYQSLNRTPAPLGHPMLNGKYVSAYDPEAMNIYGVGAFNENVRRENGRVLLDKVIDIEVANSTDNGRKLIDAINAGDPIHTSTGLLVDPEPVANNDEYQWIARNMRFDHDAILLNEQGAATPDQGVGMMVNAEGEEIDVQDIDLDDEALRDIAQSMAWRIEREQEEAKQKPLIDKIMGALQKLLSANEKATGLSVNHDEDAEMPITEEQFNELAEKVNTLADAVSKQEPVAEAVTNAVKPLAEQLEALTAANKQREEAERGSLVETVVNAGLLDEAGDAEGMSVNALQKLAAKCKPGIAAGIAPSFVSANADEGLSSELPGGAA